MTNSSESSSLSSSYISSQPSTNPSTESSSPRLESSSQSLFSSSTQASQSLFSSSTQAVSTSTSYFPYSTLFFSNTQASTTTVFDLTISSTASSSPPLLWLWILIAVLILLILIVLAIVAFFTRHLWFQLFDRKWKSDHSFVQRPESSAPTPIFNNTQFITHIRATAADFKRHIETLKNDSNFGFATQFEQIRKASVMLPRADACRQENCSKNRYADILPYDNSRVRLSTAEGESDYINASYIPGQSSPREYIATQAPLPSTVEHLWRLVWEQRVSTVVMLSNPVELGRIRCEVYWPTSPGSTQVWDDVEVCSISERVVNDMTLRQMAVSRCGSSRRTVNQLQLTSWPDKGVPTQESGAFDPDVLLRLVRTVRDLQPQPPPQLHPSSASAHHLVPILVHCSAGVGRTGTFIAVDRMLQLLETRPPTVSIFELVLEMRHHRPLMVQTEEQYMYIHECLLRALESEGRGRVNPAFSLSDLSSDAFADSHTAPTAPAASDPPPYANAYANANSMLNGTGVPMRHRHGHGYDPSVPGSKSGSRKMKPSSGASGGDPLASTTTTDASPPATTTTTLERYAACETRTSPTAENKRFSNESSGSTRSGRGGGAVSLQMPMPEQQMERSGVVFTPREPRQRRRDALSGNPRQSPDATRAVASASTPNGARAGDRAAAELELVERVARVERVTPSASGAANVPDTEAATVTNLAANTTPIKSNPAFTSFI